jgi:hypothetical protein
MKFYDEGSEADSVKQTNKGRVSEEGTERLARRVGLECLWEEGMGTGGKARTLILAGNSFSLDINFINNLADTVSLSFLDAPDIVTSHAKDAENILVDNLKVGPEESPLTKMLDKFAVNIERLAALDKLSVVPALNCHAAIAGIYESLKRLHEWEIARLKEEEGMAGKSEEYIEKTALCTKSGKPAMNAGDNVGLSLLYWQEGQSKKPDGKKTTKAKRPKTWSLVIEVAQCPAMEYPPVRVSDKWISPEIKKPNPTADDLLLATSGPVLDWQDPENVLLAPNEADKSENAMEGIEQNLNAPGSKLPDVRFVARLDPPLVVPYGVAVQIYNSTAAHLDQFPISTFDSLLFPQPSNEKGEPDGVHRRLPRQQEVPVFGESGEMEKKLHNNTLTVPKLEYGRALTEVPFSHPRELVDMLPILRQYARLSTLLEKGFGAGTTAKKEDEEQDYDEGEEEEGETIRDEFDAFMADASSTTTKPLEYQILPVDVSLYTQPIPGIRLTFPFERRMADIWINIGSNGALSVLKQNILDFEGGEENKGKSRSITAEDLGKMLEISEDIGIFAEYVRRRLQ